MLRKKFLDFFEKRGHVIVPSNSLLPTDPSVLFTTAGMQQFKEYYLGKPSPYGNRVASCQKCFRTSDIETVGDNRHLTFLEMLGNFSFGGYFKKEAIEFAYELLNSKFKIQNSKLWITYFKGNKEIPEDKESKEIWQKLGVPKNKIHGFGRKDNFWGPTGREGPCGPTTEIHYDLTGKPCQKGKNCIPNCNCGRFIELWNLVFNEYFQDEKLGLSQLQQKGVDTGMGLERLAMVVQEKPSVFETDLFEPIVTEILNPKSEIRNKFKIQNPKLSEKSARIIADHIKGAVFLAAEGVFPSNVEQGYVLRRILRRAIRFGKLLNLPENFLISLAQKAIEIYKDVYPEVKAKETDILTVIQKEEEKFAKTLEKGLSQLDKLISSKIKNFTLPNFQRKLGRTRKSKIIEGEEAFNLYQNYGFPLELSEEIAKEKSFKVDKEGFLKAQKRHREISRAGAEKKFGGIGLHPPTTRRAQTKVWEGGGRVGVPAVGWAPEADYEATKLHTATHLLHQALREILGPNVKQMGSDITPQRLRFDFSHSTKLTKEELKELEDLVNQKINEDLEIKKEEMSYEEATKSGALAFFKDKYPERVTVYSIGSGTRVFSKEICAGPHVQRTSELVCFKIVKEESSGAGVRRIKATLESL